MKVAPDGTFLAADHYQDLSVYDLAADGSGLYATGAINNVVPSDLDPGPGQWLLNPANGQGFVTRLTSNLGLTWVDQVAASFPGVTVAGGHVYATGSFTGTVDFDPGSGPFNLTSAGSSDIVVWDLTTDGCILLGPADGRLLERIRQCRRSERRRGLHGRLVQRQPGRF